MHILDIIAKKKDSQELSRPEIDFVVTGFTRGEIPDYQMSALMMAIYFQGMTPRETSDLTKAYVDSGDRLDLSAIPGIKVDKHSTGGVGDKISLIVIPLVACLGVPVAKLSGRGLGHTGGTIDKLESIPGFRTDLSPEEFIKQVQNHGLALAGQTGQLTPADKKIYALRDVTQTVDSIPLIAASIMSKKIASGADAIVLDVKCGEGAFMKDLDQATALAEAMVAIGKELSRETVAVLTDMNQPLGRAIGNATEVLEAAATLRGEGEAGLQAVAVAIAGHMLCLGKKAQDQASGEAMAREAIASGRALEKFRQFISLQGGDPSFLEDPSQLPTAKNQMEIKADRAGYCHSIQADDIGYAAMHLGAGRQTKELALDYGAGLILNKLVGDEVKLGDVLCTLLYNEVDPTESAQLAKAAFRIEDRPPADRDPILRVIQ